MSDLHEISRIVIPETSAGGRVQRAVRIARGALFFAIWLPCFVVLFAIVQRLFLWPLVTLVPSSRARVMGAWLRFQGDYCCLLLRVIGGARFTIRGAIPKEAVVAVMNHQSVADIPVALSLIRGPAPLFVTRDRYKWKIPFVSPVLRMARYPLVSQRPDGVRHDIKVMQDAAARAARGVNSILIFAEGHRTRDGSIGPFMRMGPRLILTRAARPVYTIVCDGLWGARRFTDALAHLGQVHIDITISGPFQPSADADAFVDELRDRMIATLAEMRAARP